MIYHVPVRFPQAHRTPVGSVFEKLFNTTWSQPHKLRIIFNRNHNARDWENSLPPFRSLFPLCKHVSRAAHKIRKWMTSERMSLKILINVLHSPFLFSFISEKNFIFICGRKWNEMKTRCWRDSSLLACAFVGLQSWEAGWSQVGDTWCDMPAKYVHGRHKTPAPMSFEGFCTSLRGYPVTRIERAPRLLNHEWRLNDGDKARGNRMFEGSCNDSVLL